ncbi:hypothetical protein M758_4G117900 [Ceratodon purpureus]|nr:hypothetical protein M758_4G117900 [Ceratodon purpureus]
MNCWPRVCSFFVLFLSTFLSWEIALARDANEIITPCKQAHPLCRKQISQCTRVSPVRCSILEHCSHVLN